jgi:hypothetical protein
MDACSIAMAVVHGKVKTLRSRRLMRPSTIGMISANWNHINRLVLHMPRIQMAV